ncbi:hypothetical protein BM221_003836 [Beauveria bassiana]|uniref:Uncharacterized protein n=1 Tax=Beauveria bassiana TaxID=176275 RepID=A0A2N6NPL0_BEABA|nr:hypothetical protein BM221_003836 [Beauveria bassiana]
MQKWNAEAGYEEVGLRQDNSEPRTTDRECSERVREKEAAAAVAAAAEKYALVKQAHAAARRAEKGE